MWIVVVLTVISILLIGIYLFFDKSDEFLGIILLYSMFALIFGLVIAINHYLHERKSQEKIHVTATINQQDITKCLAYHRSATCTVPVNITFPKNDKLKTY